MTNREFIRTWRGRLAVGAAAIVSCLGFVASDPTAAALFSQFLPHPYNFIFVVGLLFVSYVLPLLATKKDRKNDGKP